jgi:hypothetical protein
MLRIGVRIIADCHSAGARDVAACGSARQRSGAGHPVPEQVAALSPPVERADRAHSAMITVTY